MDEETYERKMAALRDRFRSKLPSRIENLALLLSHSRTDGQALEKAFRVAHQLRGSSGSLGFDEISDALHIIEENLDALRTGPVPLDVWKRIDGATSTLRRIIAQSASS